MATLIAVPLALALYAALGWWVSRCRASLRRIRFAQLAESELMADYLRAQNLRIDWSEHDLGYLAGAVVFVVGGGGSIGGRLAEELGAVDYRRLVLVDSDENGLYRVRRRLLELGHRPEALFLELVDVRDRAGVDHLFATHRPNVVFHYANYKSAAISEFSARAFVMVNVAGLSALLDAVRRTPSMRVFVYISSDKAERPSTVYGRTKRVCELLARAGADDGDSRAGVGAGTHPPVRIASTRYCNVLDAAGSFAIPTFRAQILARRPVTVRQMPDGSIPDRYFIDIRTAAHVALVTGARAGRGEVFSLDPYRIAPIGMDEVVRMLARAAGLRNPRRWFGRNVAYVPATAGEKVSESLGRGSPVPTAPLIDVHAPPPADRSAFLAAVEELVAACEQVGDERPARLLDTVLRTHDPAYQGTVYQDPETRQPVGAGTGAMGSRAAARMSPGTRDAAA